MFTKSFIYLFLVIYFNYASDLNWTKLFFFLKVVDAVGEKLSDCTFTDPPTFCDLITSKLYSNNVC